MYTFFNRGRTYADIIDIDRLGVRCSAWKYFQRNLIESIRTPADPRQRVVLNLGFLLQGLCRKKIYQRGVVNHQCQIYSGVLWVSSF